MKYSFVLTGIFLTFMVGMSLALLNRPSRQNHYSEDDINFLASDAHIVVGGVPLVVPFVALRGYFSNGPSFSLDRKGDRERARERLEAFRKSASDISTAPAVDKLEIGLRTYGWRDDVSPGRICARLRREWSKSICDDPWAPIQQAMPYDNNTFYLVDDRNFGAFENHYTVGDARMSAQLLAMNLIAGEPSVVCDPASVSKTVFCTAAVLVSAHLVVVWRVWNSNAESPDERAAREAKALTALVTHGLGAAENFPALLDISCKMKDPQAPDGVHPSPCKNLSNVYP